MHPANERRRYNVSSSLIGWAHTQIEVHILWDILDWHDTSLWQPQYTPGFMRTTKENIKTPRAFYLQGTEDQQHRKVLPSDLAHTNPEYWLQNTTIPQPLTHSEYSSVQWCNISTLKSRHIDEYFITGYTCSCHYENFRCGQWQNYRQDDMTVSVNNVLLFDKIQHSGELVRRLASARLAQRQNIPDEQNHQHPWSWRRHQKETFFGLRALYEKNPPVTDHKGQWRGA